MHFLFCLAKLTDAASSLFLVVARKNHSIVQRKRSYKCLEAKFYRICDISMRTLQEFATPTFLKKMGFTLQALTSNLWSGQGIGFPVSFISLLISFLEEKVALFHFSWNNFLTKFLFLFIWHLLDEFVFSFGISTIWNYQIRILVHHNQSKSKCFCWNPIFAIGTVSILGVTLV